jgi:hypothetical protein
MSALLAFPTAAVGPKRDPALQPFSESSIWNTPLGRGAKFLEADAPESIMLRSESVGGHGRSYLWIAKDALGVYRAKRDDPVVKWTYTGRSATAPWPEGGPIQNGVIAIQTPKDIRFLGGGTDGHAIIIDVSGNIAFEIFHGAFNAASGVYSAKYLVRTDLRGTGIASGNHRSEGIRAFGGSLAGGLIRCGELHAGFIDHGIAMLLSQTQQRAGKSMDQQKVWPATVTDGGGRNNYSGKIAMGSLVAIPPDVDISSLGLTPQGFALAKAFQSYGGYIVDTATNTMVLAAVEAGCPVQDVGALFKDRRVIRKYLRIVTNNGPNQIGGPGPRIVRGPPPLM